MNSARFLAAAAAQVITLAAGEQRFRQSSVSWRTVLFFLHVSFLRGYLMSRGGVDARRRFVEIDN
jgi:hypothetical protein